MKIVEVIMVLSFAINQSAPIQSSAGVPLESRGVVDTGCETSSASYTSATGNMMGGSRKSHRQHRRSQKSSSRKNRKDKKRSHKSRQHRQRRLNRTLKSQTRRSRKVDYEQQGGGASYSQLLEATPSYGDAVGSQGAMRAKVGLAETD